MKLPSLQDVKTYNPLEQGITYQHFHSLSPQGKITHYNGVQQATLEYQVAPGIIFADVLFSKGGYFDTHPETHSVIIVNGRLVAENETENELRESLNKILKNNEKEAIPVCFKRPIEPREKLSPLIPFIPAPIHIPNIEELAAA